jgi:hypothetical protein
MQLFYHVNIGGFLLLHWTASKWDASHNPVHLELLLPPLEAGQSNTIVLSDW